MSNGSSWGTTKHHPSNHSLRKPWLPHASVSGPTAGGGAIWTQNPRADDLHNKKNANRSQRIAQILHRNRTKDILNSEGLIGIHHHGEHPPSRMEPPTYRHPAGCLLGRTRPRSSHWPSLRNHNTTLENHKRKNNQKTFQGQTAGMHNQRSHAHDLSVCPEQRRCQIKILCCLWRLLAVVVVVAVGVMRSMILGVSNSMLSST